MRECEVFVGLGQRPSFRRRVGVVRRRKLDRRVGELDVEVSSVGIAHHLGLEWWSDLEQGLLKALVAEFI